MTAVLWEVGVACRTIELKIPVAKSSCLPKSRNLEMIHLFQMLFN